MVLAPLVKLHFEKHWASRVLTTVRVNDGILVMRAVAHDDECQNGDSNKAIAILMLAGMMAKMMMVIMVMVTMLTMMTIRMMVVIKMVMVMMMMTMLLTMMVAMMMTAMKMIIPIKVTVILTLMTANNYNGGSNDDSF